MSMLFSGGDDDWHVPYGAHETGWNSALNEVVTILGIPIQNADLSYETVDPRFIEKIKELFR